MRDRIIGPLCAGLLIALTFFYVGEIWVSPECETDPSGYGCAKIAKLKHYQAILPEKSDDKIARYTEMLAFFTGALALVSAVQIWFLTQADRTAQKTASAALQAAVATENSVEVAKTALRDTERAFVYLKTVEVLIERAPSTMGAYGAIDGRIIRLTLTPIWANSGRTPARRMLTCSYIEKFGPILPDDIIFDKQKTPRRAVLGPNTEAHTPGSIIGTYEYEQLEAGDITMCILGWADYNDVFPGTLRHRTEFCLQITVIIQPDGGRRIALPTYSRLNGFDDECLES